MTTEEKIHSLECVKINESETETENGTTVKYTYQFQDEDKTDIITLKTAIKRRYTINQKVDITIEKETIKTLDEFKKDTKQPTIMNDKKAKKAVTEAKKLITEMGNTANKKITTKQIEQIESQRGETLRIDAKIASYMKDCGEDKITNLTKEQAAELLKIIKEIKQNKKEGTKK